MKNSKLLFISSILFLFVFSCNSTKSGESTAIQLFKANDPNIQYMGRVDFTNPEKPKFWAPGVLIRAKFTGTECSVVLNDEHLYGKYRNYLEIIVDGKQSRIKLSADNVIKVAENLAEGEHTIEICKDTEAGIGSVEFIGFKCEKLLPPSPKSKRKIEFIGNSITCGYGNDISEMSCDSGDWYEKHNAYMAYGPRVARRLNAQWHLSSVSGIGMIHSCCDNDFIMGDVYGKTSLQKNTDDWDFKNYIPDVVTICLGQNDGVQDSTAFCSAYVKFIQRVRNNYPTARITCLTSPMANEELMPVLKNYLTGIVDFVNANGDSQVYKFFFSRNFLNGCDYHPDMNDHRLIADELEAGLKKINSW